MKLELGKTPLIIGGTVAALALAIGAGSFLVSRQPATLHQTLPSDTGIFKINNADNATLKIITAPVSEILVDVSGPANEVGKIRLFSGSGNDSKFDLPADWGSVTGTVTVPEGTVLEITPSKKTDVTLREPTGTRKKSNEKPFLVDTRNLTQILVGKTGIDIQGSGPIDILDETLHGASEPGSQGTGSGSTTCNFGSQTLRDRCCMRANSGTQTPECLGNWIYSNLTRACIYQCSTPAQGFFGDQPGTGPATGGALGTPSENLGNGGASGTPEPGALPGAKPLDYASISCMSLPRADRSQCCDFKLGNPLRIGPRPGFPDCIGTWQFDPATLNCGFKCADYGEMLNILNTLRVNAPTE